MKYFFIFPIIPAGIRPDSGRIRAESGRIPGGSGRIPDRNQLSGTHVSIMNFVDLGKINKKVYQADPP